jgi:Family of unknown function (DUF6527)
VGIKLHETVRPDGSHYAWGFYCPGCKGLHQCDDRWTFNGDKEKPTFRASILVYEVPGDPIDGASYAGSPRCHSFVTDGRIEYLSDSTHELRGQTVDLPDWDSVRDPYG